MGFFKRSKSQNFDIYGTHAYFVPGVGDMFILLALMLAGSLLGGVVTAAFLICGLPLGQDFSFLLAYPMMFIPPMVYASYMGRRNLMFDKGYALDSNNFAPRSGGVTAVVCMIAIVACECLMEPVNEAMPPMPEWLENMLKSLTTGNVWINFICVSLFAPIFEEWLCRGMILRGLLNSKKSDGNRLMSPAAAIVVSALFFAVIHLNPWQAINAFALGLLMGYVYYKTGSLKMTMLMHFTNNTLALVLAQSLKDIEGLDPVNTSLKDVMSPWLYALIWVLALAIMVGCFYYFRSIKELRPEGNSDIVEPSAE